MPRHPQTSVKRRGPRFNVQFLPIAHSELNPIELMWHYIKEGLRSTIDGTKAKLDSELRLYMPGGTKVAGDRYIKAWFSHVEKYIDAYRLGQTGLEAYKRVKQFSSRRGAKRGFPKKPKVTSHHRTPRCFVGEDIPDASWELVSAVLPGWVPPNSKPRKLTPTVQAPGPVQPPPVQAPPVQVPVVQAPVVSGVPVVLGPAVPAAMGTVAVAKETAAGRGSAVGAPAGPAAVGPRSVGTPPKKQARDNGGPCASSKRQRTEVGPPSSGSPG